jgi:hypothetical protein
MKESSLKISINENNEDIRRLENATEEKINTEILEFDPEKMMNRKYWQKKSDKKEFGNGSMHKREM